VEVVMKKYCIIRPRINLLHADFSKSFAPHRDTYLRLVCIDQASRACIWRRDFHQTVLRFSPVRVRLVGGCTCEGRQLRNYYLSLDRQAVPVVQWLAFLTVGQFMKLQHDIMC